MTPAIEQAVKALERISKMYANTWDLVDGGLMMFQEGIPEFEAAHEDVVQALTSLRALTEPAAVSKTDEELARELADKFEQELCGSINSGFGVDLLTQAFTAIRAQARSEVLEEAAEYFQIQLDKFNEEHSMQDMENGVYEYGNNAEAEYAETMTYFIEEIRKLKYTK
jgi:hypothetical protein